MENQNSETPKPEKMTAKEKAAMAALYTGAAAGGLGAAYLLRQAVGVAAALIYHGTRLILTR